MIQHILDKSFLNLLTVLISGTGIFAILLKYNVPQINASFWNENPYQIKRDIIENVMTWIFILIALVGLLIQTYSIIFGDAISERLHSTSFYLKAFVIGIIVIGVFVNILGIVGNCIAKKKWLPVIVEKQAEIYEIAKQITENEGFPDEQKANFERYPNEKRTELLNKYFDKADEYIAQIEDLLEIKKSPSSRKEKISNLSKYFNKNNS